MLRVYKSEYWALRDCTAGPRAGAHSSKSNKTPKVLSTRDLFRSITESSCMETARPEMSHVLGNDGVGHSVPEGCVHKTQRGEFRDKPALGLTFGFF